MGYMSRLGLWGSEMAPFLDYQAFRDALGAEKTNLGTLEVLAMDFKASGSHVARSVSYKHAEFEMRDIGTLDSNDARLYRACAEMWRDIVLAVDACLALTETETGHARSQL